MAVSISFPPPQQHTAIFTTTNFTQDGVVQATGGGPYSFTVPAGVYELIANYAGGGGGGAGGFASAGGGGGGGGAGAARWGELIAVTPGETITVTLGAAGTGGAISAVGIDGGATTLASTTIGTRSAPGGLHAAPGTASNGGNGGAGGGGSGAAGAGGAGAGGTGQLASTSVWPHAARSLGGVMTGGGGGGAPNFNGGNSLWCGGNTNATGTGGTLNATNGGGGAGGSTCFGPGQGGAGGTNAAGSSPNAASYGAGGGGGAGNQAGAAGAAGFCQFFWVA